jgi:MipA family protein
MGSDAWGAAPRPYFDWRRAEAPESFHGARDGTGIALFDNGVVAAGPVGSLTWPRKEAYSPFLNGLGNVGFTVQVGGFMDYWAVPWLRTRVEGLEGFGGASVPGWYWLWRSI